MSTVRRSAADAQDLCQVGQQRGNTPHESQRSSRSSPNAGTRPFPGFSLALRSAKKLIDAPHNPKVTGSNPAPATSQKARKTGPSVVPRPVRSPTNLGGGATLRPNLKSPPRPLARSGGHGPRRFALHGRQRPYWPRRLAPARRSPRQRADAGVVGLPHRAASGAVLDRGAGAASTGRTRALMGQHAPRTPAKFAQLARCRKPPISGTFTCSSKRQEAHRCTS